MTNSWVDLRIQGQTELCPELHVRGQGSWELRRDKRHLYDVFSLTGK